MKVNIVKLDEQVEFLREQAGRLRVLANKPGNQWAERQARKMEEIVEVLLEVRRDSQMTTMNGRRID